MRLEQRGTNRDDLVDVLETGAPEQVREGYLDVAEDGRIAGIEVLGASRLVDLQKLTPLEFARAG